MRNTIRRHHKLINLEGIIINVTGLVVKLTSNDKKGFVYGAQLARGTRTMIRS